MLEDRAKILPPSQFCYKPVQRWKARKETQFPQAPKFSSIQESQLPAQPLFTGLSRPGA